MIDYQKIKLIIFDCDGVLSDGKVIYTKEDWETKSFSAFDGLGITFLPYADIKSAVITGRKSDTLVKRCRELEIDFLYQNIKNKVAIAQIIIDKLGLSWDNLAFMGDDWNDYALMQKVQLSGTTNNAFTEIKNSVDFVSARNGGNGAVREFIELILKKQNKFDEVISKYLEHLNEFQYN